MCTGPYPSVFEFQRGVDDTTTFSQQVGCVARVGTGGCGFEQQLEAVLKALSPSRPQSWTAADYLPPIFEGNTTGRGDGANAGFVREDSVLAVLVLTDEEDCSAANPDLFNPDSTTFDGAPLNLRCFAYPEATHPIGRFVDGLSRLRRDPRRFVYTAIVGIPLDADPGSTAPNYAAILDHPSMVEREDPTMPERLIPSCEVDEQGVAFPPRRIVSVARDLSALGAGTAVHSICQADYGPAIENISRIIASRAESLCE